MLTNEDTDCIVQDISDAGCAPLGSIEKPSAIDAIQKHVEESLLFLDEKKTSLENRENTTGASHSKLNIVLEKPESEYTIMQDVNDSLRNIEIDANDKNTGEPLKISTVILKQDNPNDALLSDELQKGESEIKSVKTENKVVSLLQFEKEETHYTPEQMETHDHILSIKDNPISASVLKEIDKDTAMNDPREETSGISDETDTIKVIVSREQHPSSDCAVNEINSDTVVNVSMEQKSAIPLLTNSDYSSLQFEKEETRDIPEQMETNDHILALEDNPISASVLKEIDKDTAMNDPQQETSGISDETDTIKVFVSREQQPHNSSSGCAVNEINSDTVVNVSMEQKSEIPLLTNSDYSSLQFEKEETRDIPEQMETNDHIPALEDNPLSAGVLKEIDKVTAMNDPQEESSGISNESDTIKVIVSREKHPSSDCVVNEIDSDTVVNVSIKQKSEIPLLTNSYYGPLQFEKEETRFFIPEQIDTSKYIVSHEDDPPSDSAVHETDSDAVANDSQRQQSEIPRLTEGKTANIEDNPTSDTVLKHIKTDAISNDSENKSCELSSQIDDNKVRSALQEDNPLFLSTLNKTHTDATIYDCQLKSSDISEQSAVIKVCNTSHEDNPSSENVRNETDTNEETDNVQETASDISIVLHEGISQSDSLLDDTDADVTTNFDSLEKFGLNSGQISNVSKEQNSLSDSLLNKIDLDANMDDTQEGISEISQQIYDKGGSNDSQEKDLSSEGVLDEIGADVSTNGPEEEISDISDQFVINDISNISQENNNVLNESDIDASMNVSLEIPEVIQIKEVSNIYQYKVLNKTNTDVTMNDSQEGISDISEIINSKDVSIISQDNIPSDNVLNKTDTDVIMSNSQEEFHDMKTYNIDDSNISEKDSGILNSELDKRDAVLLEECETDNKTVEAFGNYQDNLKTIIKEDNENNVTEPQKDGILVETKEIINPTDETTHDLDNTKTGDKQRDQLPELESNAEKTVLSESDTQVKNKFEETGQATQKSPVKGLVWEIKSNKTGAEQLGKKELLQKERSQDKNAVENPKNPLVRALPLEDVSECPPAKRPRFQPVWKTNPLYDEASSSDETTVDDNNITKSKDKDHPYKISPEAKKQLHSWLIKTRIAHPRAKYMQDIIKAAKWNRAVLRMKPIPEEYKPMDVFRIIRDKTEAYDKEISKNIQYIHIHKRDDNFNAAYIKWRDIDKLLVVKAHHILATTCTTTDGAVKQPLFKYDNRSIIDWNEKERPILKLGDGTIVTPESASTLKDTPVVTPIATATGTTSATPVAKPVAATVSKPVAATVATPAATPVATPRPRKTPPTPFTDGKVNPKDRQCFGLSAAFMKYYNIKVPIGCLVFVGNLDISHSVETYRRIFSAAGDIVDWEVISPPPHSEPTSFILRIAYNHGLEAVQAVSMFHEQILHGRVIEVKMGHIGLKRKPFAVEGFSTLGPGLGFNGFAMRNIRSSIELGKFKAKTKDILDNCKLQISSLRQKLSAATFKLEQNKRDEEKRRYKEEKLKIQSKNESQNKQANMNAVSAITNAIASSVQANVISMLGVQLNQQGQNIKQTLAPVNNQPSGTPQNQNKPKAPLKWTANETAKALPNTATALPNPATPLRNPTALLPNSTATLPNPTATLPNPTTLLPNPTTPLPNPTTLLSNPTTPLPNPNVHGQTSMGNAFINPGGQLQTYQNPQDPYGYYARLQQAYAQYGYHMDPTLLQAHAYLQPGTAYVQPIPPVEASYVPPTAPNSQTMPAIIANEPGPSKPSLTQNKVHTESKTVFPPLPNSTKNVIVYETKKTPATADNKTTTRTRFDVPPANLGQTTEPKSTVPEMPLPIKPSHPAVKMAFKIHKPVVPPKETKPGSIKINIPSVLPDTAPSVIQNPRSLEKHSAQKNYMNEGKLRAEPWINKHIRDMRRNSKSPERTRKSPENIKSPDRTQKSLPKPMLPKGVKPEKRRMSRSPDRRNSRSPVRRRSRSTEKRRASRSPKRRRSRSPIRRRSRSTERRRRSRSTDRRRMSRSPKRGLERSPQRGLAWSPKRGLERSPQRGLGSSPKRGLERSSQRGLGRSPKRGLERSPQRGLGWSPKRGLERSPQRGLGSSPKRGLGRSPVRRRSRSPKRRDSKSPIRRKSRSPVRRSSRSPVRRDRRSPVRRYSKSPARRNSKSPVRRDKRSPVRRLSKSPVRSMSKSPVRSSMPASETKGTRRSRSAELGPKPTARPAYEPGAASSDITNMNLRDVTDDYNYEMKWNEMERELANTSVNFRFLPSSVTTEDLTEKMGEIGELLEVQAFGMGRAFVVFKFRNDAETCIEMYNMAKVDGQMIEVTWASIE